MSNDPYDGVNWYDALDLGLRGMGWLGEAREQAFDRFPLSLKPHISESLWGLSVKPAGVHVDFKAASRQLFARWDLSQDSPSGDKVSSLPQCGLDCYGRDHSGRWHWVGSRSPWNAPTCDGSLSMGILDGMEREYRVYLPISTRISRLMIGSKEELSPIDSKDHRRPIAYYGTSIVHGAGVGRPGMPHACQLARMLDREVLNLGFFGKAFCELPVADAIGRLDAELIVVDCVPNNSPEQLLERLPPFLKRLRELRPDTPILVVEDRLYGCSRFQSFRAEEQRTKNLAMHQVVDQLRRDGTKGLHVAAHPNWFGDDGEGTVDGSHPNDLGAHRMAKALLPQVEAILSHPN